MSNTRILFEKQFNSTGFKPYSNDRVLLPSEIQAALIDPQGFQPNEVESLLRDHVEACKFIYGLTRKGYVQFKKDVLTQQEPLTSDRASFIRQICRERSINNDVKILLCMVRGYRLELYYGTGTIDKNKDRYYEVFSCPFSPILLNEQDSVLGLDNLETRFETVLDTFCNDVGVAYGLSKNVRQPISRANLHVAHQISNDLQKRHFCYERLRSCIWDTHFDRSIMLEYDHGDLLLEAYNNLREDFISTAKLCYMFGFSLKGFLDSHRKDWFKLNVFDSHGIYTPLHVLASQERREIQTMVADLRWFELKADFMQAIKNFDLDMSSLESNLQQHFITQILLWDYLIQLNGSLCLTDLIFDFKNTNHSCA